MSMFNEHGNVMEFPDDLFKAQQEYFNVLKKHLDQMTILEVRAFCYYINLNAEVAAYIVRRQLDMRKNENKDN